MATRYWVGGGSSTNWNATGNTNWGTASGVADNASVPGSSDDVIFDGAGSGNGPSVISADITILSLTFTAGYTNTVTQNASRRLIIGGNFTDNTAHSWVGNNGSTNAFTITASSTITSNGQIYPSSVLFEGTITVTLVGNWEIGGRLTYSGVSSVTFNKTTAETMTCAGGFTAGNNGAGGTITKIIVTGGTITGNAANVDMDVNGTVTITGQIIGNGKTFTLVGGTITISGLTIAAGGTIVYSGGTIVTSVIAATGSCTFNTGGMSWDSVSVSGSGTTTLTLNSVLQSDTLILAASSAFAGSYGFTVNTFSCTHTTATSSVTFANSITYIINKSFSAYQSRVGLLVFTSDHASNKAIIILSYTAACNVLTNFRRIDASGGRPILTFNGTITDCNNVISYSDIQVIPEKFNRVSNRVGVKNNTKSVKYINN